MIPSLLGNTADLQKLKTSIQGSPVAAAFAAGDDNTVIQYYNGPASPAYVVYKGKDAPVPVNQIGENIHATELLGLTSGKLQALQALCGDLSGGFIDPSVKDRRDAFDQIFSAAGGQVTRPRLQALWPRNATVAEKLFATGTGNTSDPGTMAYGGALTIEEVSKAREV